MEKQRLRWTDYLLLLLIIAVFVAFSLLYQVNQKFNFDQTQMLLKGFYALFEGSYLPWGNEASVLGNLPGYISSWVIGFPLKIEASAMSMVVFQLIIRILGILLFANALTMCFNRKAVLFGTFVFALSPWMLYQTMLFNPAYISFGAALCFNALIRLARENGDPEHQMSERSRFVWTLLLVLSVGFCMQLHFSWPVLAATIGIMWLRKDIKVNYRAVLIGIGIVVLSLIPFVIEVIFNPTLLTNPSSYAQERYLGYGLVNVLPVLKGLLYWFRFGSLLITEKALSPILEDASLFTAILGYGWVGLADIVGGISVIFVIYANWVTLVRRGIEKPERYSLVRGLTISAILSVLLAAAAAPLYLNYWQIAIMVPFAILPVLVLLQERERWFKPAFAVTAVFFLLVNISGSCWSEKFDIRSDFNVGIYHNCLLGFTKEQCAPFARDLTPEQKLETEQNTHFSQETYDRVIKGIIPTPEQTEGVKAAPAPAEAAEPAEAAAPAEEAAEPTESAALVEEAAAETTESVEAETAESVPAEAAESAAEKAEAETEVVEAA